MDSRITAFSDSNDISNGSSICCATTIASPSDAVLPAPAADSAALRRLSDNLDYLFDSSSDSYSDAKIVVSGDREIPVHRCILSVRSPFFRSKFADKRREKGGVRLELKDLAEKFEVGVEALIGVLAYLYSGKVRALPKGVCVCVDEDCSHIGCRPAVDFMVQVLYLSYTFQIAELVALYQRHLLEILDKVAPDDLLVVLSVATTCKDACERLLERCRDMIVKSNVAVTTLDKSFPPDTVKQIIDERKKLGVNGPEYVEFPDKHAKRIQRALESDDVELVKLLLTEGHATLDDAFALHYAVLHCDAKTTTELLDLEIADVNRKDFRGYTVLHIAAMRKEPKIIVSLLTRGAQPTDVTPDGRKAIQIAKRLTKALDFYKSTEQGKDTPKDKLCIEVLEQAERREPLLGEGAVSLAKAGEDQRMKLLYLENRVALAKLLFPIEAKVAMEIAIVDGTSEFTFPKNIADARRNSVDLNGAPFIFNEECMQRMNALSKTVDLGKHFFPRCSGVLNQIMDDDDLPQLAFIGNDTPEERLRKKRRYHELEETFLKAFTEDKQDFLSSSSSSAPLAKLNVVVNNNEEQNVVRNEVVESSSSSLNKIRILKMRRIRRT